MYKIYKIKDDENFNVTAGQLRELARKTGFTGTFKRVFPALYQEEENFYKSGQKFIFNIYKEKPSIAMLVQVGPGNVALVIIDGWDKGNRLSSAVEVAESASKVSLEEFRRATGNCWQYYVGEYIDQ